MVEKQTVTYRLDRKCDIYTPPKATSQHKGAIIVIHGGAFVTSDRSAVSSMSKQLALLTNFVVFAPDYQLSTFNTSFLHTMLLAQVLVCVVVLLLLYRSKTISVFSITLLAATSFLTLQATTNNESEQSTHPQHITDIAHCYRYVRQMGAQYHYNPENICLLGHSAGAHLSALLACNQRFLTELQQADGDVGIHGLRCVVGISGVYEHTEATKSFWLRVVYPSVIGHSLLLPRLRQRARMRRGRRRLLARSGQSHQNGRRLAPPATSLLAVN